MIYLKQCIMNSSVHISHVGLPSPARSRSLICISWNSLSFIWWTTSSFSSFVFALLYPFALRPFRLIKDEVQSGVILLEATKIYCSKRVKENVFSQKLFLGSINIHKNYFSWGWNIHKEFREVPSTKILRVKLFYHRITERKIIFCYASICGER